VNSLIGLHEPGGEHLFDERKGWITFTHELGHDANVQAGFDYQEWNRKDIGCIARLNNGYGAAGTIPEIKHYADFAQRCANWVRNSSGCWIYIIGNEPNVSWERPNGQMITWQNYLDCFLLCYDKIKVADPNVLVLPAAIGPWNAESGDWLREYLQPLIGQIHQRGKLDGGAIHAYTHEHRPEQVSIDDVRHGWQWQFRTYEDQALSFPPGYPLYITECDPNGWQDVDNGWIVAVYERLRWWNGEHPDQKIYCCNLYRWPLVHDQPQHAISTRPGVIQDLKKAIAIGFPFDEEPEPPEPPDNGGTVIKEGFESGFYAFNGSGELTVPVGWTPVWVQGNEPGVLVRPEYKPAGLAQVHTGTGAVAIHSRSATIDGALYRQYSVQRGTEVTVSGWCLKTEDAAGGGQQIGIDPTGGVDHTSGNVMWSDWYSQYSPDYAVNKWRQRSVSAVAKSSKITIFLRSKVDYGADGFNTHFDDLEITLTEGNDPEPEPSEGGYYEVDLHITGKVRWVPEP
jgi:hypothetical protein